MRKLYRSHDRLTTFSFPKKKLIVVKKKMPDESVTVHLL